MRATWLRHAPTGSIARLARAVVKRTDGSSRSGIGPQRRILSTLRAMRLPLPKLSDDDWNLISLTLLIKIGLLAFGVMAFVVVNDEKIVDTHRALEIWNRWDAPHYLDEVDMVLALVDSWVKALLGISPDDDHGVLSVDMLEEVVNAIDIHESRDEVKVCFTVLNASSGPAMPLT